MGDEEDDKEKLVSFAPYETEKTSKLPYQGPHKIPRIEISEPQRGLGGPAVIFRKLRTPTPTPAHDLSTASSSSKRAPPPKIVVVKPSEQTKRRAGGRSVTRSKTPGSYEKSVTSDAKPSKPRSLPTSSSSPSNLDVLHAA